MALHSTKRRVSIPIGNCLHDSLVRAALRFDGNRSGHQYVAVGPDDGFDALAHHWDFRQIVRHALRPRVLIYTTILAAVTVALFTHLALRVPLKVDVLRDRGVLGREVDGGAIENIYRLQVMNTQERAQWFDLRAEGIAGAVVVGVPGVQLDAASSSMVPVRVRIPPGAAPKGNHPIEFVVTSAEDPKLSVRERAIFVVR